MRKTLNPRFEVSESLEVLDQMAAEMLEIDAAEKTWLYHYSDADIMNAVLVFNHVLSNRYAHSLNDRGQIALPSSIKASGEMGQRIRDLVLDMTGVDTQKYYFELEEQQ
jgi:hypothetical protein